MAKLKTLNLGCGDRIYSNYPNKYYDCVNLDNRETLSRVDVVSDVRDLSRFKDDEFDYILASDIIEHFPIRDTIMILEEWLRVLKNKCIIEFRFPNLRKICELYLNGTHDAKMTSWLLYGAQDYPGNFHYVCFDKSWFLEICKEVGLSEVDSLEEGNNMVIKVRKD